MGFNRMQSKQMRMLEFSAATGSSGPGNAAATAVTEHRASLT
jgi:hypothetical protein